jgi:GAF domain
LLGDTLDHERVYDRFHELLERIVPHDGVVVSSYDERDGLIRAEYCWTDGARLDVSTFPPLPLNRTGGGMQSRVITSGESIVFNDVAEVVKQPGGTFYDVDREGTFRKLPDEGPPPTRAAMMAPVKHEGKVVGVVQVMTSQTEFSAEQLETMEGSSRSWVRPTATPACTRSGAGWRRRSKPPWPSPPSANALPASRRRSATGSSWSTPGARSASGTAPPR